MTEQIIATGKQLASINPESKALKNARQWWKSGCLCVYSNQDFDILQAMQSDIDAHYREIKKQQQSWWNARLAN